MRTWGMLPRAIAVLLLAAPLLVAGPGPALAKGTPEQQLEQKRFRMLLEFGQKHLEIGVWCRDRGLVPQATAEFIRAVEVSDGRHPGAQKVLSLMQSLDDAFWKKQRRTKHQGLLDEYEKRARRAAEDEVKERIKLAEWAGKKSALEEQSLAEYVDVLRDLDRPIEVDGDGRIVVPGDTIAKPIADRIVAAAVTINEKLYVRDAFLEKLPDVGAIYEATDERVRVRTMKDEAQAKDLVALTLALLPRLEEDTGGRPTRRMNVFVFGDKKTYDAYLDAAGLAGHKVAAGLAVSSMNVALVDGGGRDAEAIRGITLHEVSHLFDMGVTRGVMPSWYREGFAETYGGTGTFKWDGATLELGGPMAAFRTTPLKSEATRIPLRELFASSAHDLLRDDKAKGAIFYAQSWALMRYLREAAPEEIREQFELWQAMCRGAALGSEIGKPDSENSTPSLQELDRRLGPHVDAIEAGFAKWLQEL